MEHIQQNQNRISKFEVARTAVVRKSDSRLLILWRNHDDEISPGLADLPGGGVDPGESYRNAAVREAKEEAGLRLAEDALHHICDVNTLEEQTEGVVQKDRSFYMAVVDDEQEVVLGSEHFSAEWLPIDQAAEVLAYSTSKMMCIDGLRSILAASERQLTE